MKLFVLVLFASFGVLSQCSLLEMSRMLWSRLLAGGLTKGGPLDPLRVPVVKVDQSEGDTSYRIILRNVEINGLNSSTLESVHIARGRLKSNLSEFEAGYVSYSDLKDLDSIRYRFHTLVKEPKDRNGSERISSGQTEGSASQFVKSARVEDPVVSRFSKYQDGDHGSNPMDDPYSAATRSGAQFADGGDFQNSKDSKYRFGDGGSTFEGSVGQEKGSIDQFIKLPNPAESEYSKYADDDLRRGDVKTGNLKLDLNGENNTDVNSKPVGNSSEFYSVHSGDRLDPVEIVYAVNYKDADESKSAGYQEHSSDDIRMRGIGNLGENGHGINPGLTKCTGICDKAVDPSRGGQRQDDHGEAAKITQESVKSDQNQYRSRGSTRYRNLGGRVSDDDAEVSVSENFERKQEYVRPKEQGQNYERGERERVFSDNDAKVSASENFERKQEYVRPEEQRQNGNMSERKKVCVDNSVKVSASENLEQKQEYVRPEEQRQDEKISERERVSGDHDAEGSASVNFEQKQEYVNPKEQREDKTVAKSIDDENRQTDKIGWNVSPVPSKTHQRYQEAAKENDSVSNGASERSDRGPYQEIRLEKKPGYVDIVYAENTPDRKIKHFGNLKINDDQDTKVYSLEEAMQDLYENRRFIIHNFTEDESLKKRNDMVRAAAESRRIKNMIRYAQEHQEKQGYFEQGMQLIYHFGGMEANDTEDDVDGNPEVNETKRRKREHVVEDDEDDVMHVVVRVRVPMLLVKANYVLTGKVDKQILRGNGLLTGNFTELIADFTVEMKKVGDDLMVVRAARAKLVAMDRKVVLQGIDEKGPVESILVHGLMAAEAVAAMLADDLATKALSEKTADAMIYKMYKNTPVV